MRLLAAIVAVPIFYSVETWLVFRAAGGLVAALFAMSLPLSGLLAYRYLAGAGRFRSRLRFAMLAATHGAVARRLVVERQAIVGELEQAKTEWLAATKGSSF